MKKWLMGVFVTVLFIIVMFSGGSGFSQENIKAVDDSAFAERIRPKVAFFHDDHNEKAGIDDCSKCHHVYDGAKVVEDESSEDKECSACHVNEQGENLQGLAATYHLRCKGCHMENKKGPVTCSECHVKK